jgi:hypothetical protein
MLRLLPRAEGVAGAVSFAASDNRWPLPGGSKQKDIDGWTAFWHWP